MKPISFNFFFVIVFLIIFNPYTIYGKPGLVIGAVLLIFGFFNGAYKNINIDFFCVSLILTFISIWGALVSVLNGIPQITHLYAALSFIFIVMISHVLAKMWESALGEFNEFIILILYAIIFNSIVIIAEAFYPALKDAIEFFLAPAGNIDWKDSFRLRGLAASGGSGLSIVFPIGFIICLYLFNIGYIKYLRFFIFSALLLFGTVFVGRTGLVFFPVACVAFILCDIYFSKKISKRFFNLIFLMLAAIAIVFISLPFVINYFESVFGEYFVDYSFGFLLDGKEGIEREGTVNILIDFMQVLPLEFPYLLTGYGFYGGSEFAPWTDSGFARMPLSVGFPFALIFYILILYCYTNGTKKRWDLIIPIIIILILSEVKGSFLFSEFASRVLILISVMAWSTNRKLSMQKVYGL